MRTTDVHRTFGLAGRRGAQARITRGPSAVCSPPPARHPPLHESRHFRTARARRFTAVATPVNWLHVPRVVKV